MASWDEQIAAYEAKIAALEAEAVSYVKSVKNILIVAGASAFVLGILVGHAL